MAGNDPLLALEAVTIRFGKRDVLTGADLAIAHGEIIGVSGPNGAGKTTLLRVAANMLRPAKGRRIGRPRLAYVPAAVDPPLLQTGVWLAGVRRTRRVPTTSVLEQLGFDGALDRPCRELSFGNLRKVLLADAFSSLADLIVIDEATEGLDSRGAAALVELMVEARNRGASVLFAEQQTQRMVGADRLVSVRQGTLVVEALSGGEVTVSLRGPAQALSELTKSAEALGFRYIVERVMITFNLQLAARSMRWIGPALVLLIWILLALSSPGPALSNSGNLFLLLVALSSWLTVTIGNADDDGHRELLAAAIGSPARLHRSRAISAFLAANTLSAAGTLACLLASSRATRPTAEIVIVGACVLMQFAATAIGVGIGTLLHRPVLRHAGVTLLVTAGALVGIILLPPVQFVLRALNDGRTTGVVALAAAGGAIALAAVTAASALADRRN